MESYGSLEEEEQINLCIRPTELHGLGPLLERRCLQTTLVRSHGMESDGLLEEQEQINLRIRPTGSIGLRPLLEML